MRRGAALRAAALSLLVASGGGGGARAQAGCSATDFGQFCQEAQATANATVYDTSRDEGASPRLPLSDYPVLGSLTVDRIAVSPRPWTQGFPGVGSQKAWFAIHYQGCFRSPAPCARFRVTSDDGSILRIWLFGQMRDVISAWRLQAARTESSDRLCPGAGWTPFELLYHQGPPHDLGVVFEAQALGARNWRPVEVGACPADARGASAAAE